MKKQLLSILLLSSVAFTSKTVSFNGMKSGISSFVSTTYATCSDSLANFCENFQEAQVDVDGNFSAWDGLENSDIETLITAGTPLTKQEIIVSKLISAAKPVVAQAKSFITNAQNKPYETIAGALAGGLLARYTVGYWSPTYKVTKTVKFLTQSALVVAGAVAAQKA